MCNMLMQALTREKAKGQTMVNAPVDCAERLYSGTSSEGREALRNELRVLRERWEQYLDKLSAVDHAVEQALARWNSFNEQLRELDGWLKETAVKVAAHGPNDSFQDKKDELQRLKVRCQLRFISIFFEYERNSWS
jgi:nesprin-1